jgi:putative glutamine amidotransferase
VARQPVVAVTSTTEIIRGLPRVRVNEAYTSALTGAGIIPLVVAPIEPALAAGIVDRVDGILLTGGEDVSPQRYSAASHPRTDPPHEGRDAFEIALIAAARSARVPVLAICRGLQIMNVALGGTLVQDIPSQRESSLRHDRADARASRVHEVRVSAGSGLAQALGATSLLVNSSHHQAVDRPGSGLTISATAPDGVIEGAEWTQDDGWWMLGVQWHPEELIGTAEDWDRSLFGAFRNAMAAATSVAR